MPDTQVEFYPFEVEDALRPPAKFFYTGDNREMFRTWGLGPVIEQRNSTLLDQSNAAALLKYLRADPSLDGEWAVERCSHFLAGWVDHLTFHVIDGVGVPTRVARVLKAWFEDRSRDPIADEADFAAREREATVSNVREAGRLLVSDAAPANWPDEACRWFGNHEPSAVEDCDGFGGCPSTEATRRCLAALGWLDDEE